MKLVTTIKDDKFTKVVVPKLIEIKSLSKLEKLSNRDYLPMKEYLLKYYGVVLEEVLKDIHNKFIVNKNGNYSIIEVSPTIKVNDYLYDNIVRLIDYGNVEVKGLHLVDESMKNIQSQLYVIYNLYEKGGLKYGN